MKLLKLILFIITILFQCKVLNAQIYSSIGKEFWLTVPKQSTYSGINDVSAKIYITSKNNCSGLIKNRFGSFSQSFEILGGKQNVIDIPVSLFYSNEFEIVEQKGAFIQTTDSVQLFLAVKGLLHFYEITQILPLQSLGSDYMILTYANSAGSLAQSLSGFLILGVEDNSLIEISPNQTSINGIPPIPFTIQLNQGESYFYQANKDMDLTGSFIHALNCKKVAVFSGANLSFIPISCPLAAANNMLLEQNLPVNTLGTAFLISPAPNMEKELIKIVATQNNTVINVNGIIKTIINKGVSYEEYCVEPTFIKTNKPVSAAHFGVGFCSTTQKYGGPFMTMITPIEQAIKYSTISTSINPPLISNQYLSIYVKTTDKDFTYLNNKNISSQFKLFPKLTEYSVAQILLDTGVYVIQNSNGYTAEVSGYRTGTSGTSYGYSAGSLLNKSNQYASVNGNSSNLQKEFLFCPMQAVNFEAVRQDTVFSKVFWHFDDGSIDSGNVVNKTFKDTGCHQVQMISYYSGSSGNCLLGNGATDTTFLKVCVVNSLPLSIGNDTGFCRNRPLTLQSNINPDGFSYLWSTGATSSAISVTETGNYWLELKNGNCAIRDSVQVTVVDKPVLSIQGDKLLCSGDSILLQNSVNSPTVTYTWNNGKKGFSQWINKPGLYSLSGIDRGCYAETSINIGELSCPEIYVPTGFTPDGDGRNDIIRPICAGIDLVYFRVYNRFGQMIFETREDGKGWNGKLNGIQQSMATYVYVVEGRDKSGRQHIRKGTFVLIR